MVRKHMAGTGWKMNHLVADTERYAADLRSLLPTETARLDAFVLPPFTALSAAGKAFSELPVSIGGQNVHWSEAGAWTGEVSAPMLAEVGCRYVALSHSERLKHFAETYELAALKIRTALDNGLTPIVCLGETTEEKPLADDVLARQVTTALDKTAAGEVGSLVLAYEPRWAIGTAEAATPGYVAERHGQLRNRLRQMFGAATADSIRIIYGGAVNAANGPAIAALSDVDGLFVGRAAWQPAGFAQIIDIVVQAARVKGALK